MGLTKDKLTNLLQTQTGFNRKTSSDLLESLLDIMKDTLIQGEDLLITGFGKFSVRQKRARRGRNPQTSENLILGPRKVLVFRASGVLRKRLNQD
jgi:integration host factor subunit alpha